MTLMQVGLDDKYRLESKRIYLSGIQALVRLPMLQRERDRLQNLNTAGFISGYRGSPLGMYDHALWRAKSFLQAQDIAFVPGLNEDLAATAVWRSQQVGLPRLAAWDVRPRAVARQIVPASPGHRLRPRPERRFGGNRGMGQPAGRATAARRLGCTTTRCGAPNRSCKPRTSPSSPA